MEVNNKPTGLTRALTIAYNAVISFGYTHQRLVDEKFGVNYNTLRRIRDGKAGRISTDEFFLQFFVSILNEEYNNCNKNADTAGSRNILQTMKKILFARIELALE